MEFQKGLSQSCLGNLYPLYLDESLKNRGIYAIRYVDDYCVFCNPVRESCAILKDCSGVLRSLGLNIQPLKTSIVSAENLNEF